MPYRSYVQSKDLLILLPGIDNLQSAAGHAGSELPTPTDNKALTNRPPPVSGVYNSRTQQSLLVEWKPLADPWTGTVYRFITAACAFTSVSPISAGDFAT